MNTIVTDGAVGDVKAERAGANEVKPERPSRTPASATVRVPEELAAVWVRLLSAPWSSLSLLPTSEGARADGLSSCFDAMVARCCEGTSSRVIDLRDSPLEVLQGLRAELAAASERGSRILLLVGDPAHDPLAEAIVAMTDAAVLLIRAGEAQATQVEQTAARCPMQRLLGSVLLK